MKLISRLTLIALLSLVSVSQLTSCGSANSSETMGTTVSESDFESGSVNFIVYGPTDIRLAPSGVYVPSQGTQGGVVTSGQLYIGDAVIPVTYDYEVIGDPDAPSGAYLDVTLLDTSYIDNEDLIAGLGMGGATKFTSLSFTFNFHTATCDILAGGYQTITTTAGTEEVIVNTSHVGKSYRVTASGV